MMNVHKKKIEFKKEDLVPHKAGYKIMVLRTIEEGDRYSIIVPELFFDKSGKLVTKEESVKPTGALEKEQVLSIIKLVEKQAPVKNLYVYIVSREDEPTAFGICADINPLEKWSFTEMALPGMEVSDIETFVNDEKNIKN